MQPAAAQRLVMATMNNRLAGRTRKWVLILSSLAGLSSCAVAAVPNEVPEIWENFYKAECYRFLDKAWSGLSDQRTLPEASCSDFAFFSSTVTKDLLIHQEAYTGGGGFNRWFVLEKLDAKGTPQVLREDHGHTAQFITVGGKTYLELSDGQDVDFHKWDGAGLRQVFSYRARDPAWQRDEDFATYRIIDEVTQQIFVVYYEVTTERHGSSHQPGFQWRLYVDQYSPKAGVWSLSKPNRRFTPSLRRKLEGLDPKLRDWLKEYARQTKSD